MNDSSAPKQPASRGVATLVLYLGLFLFAYTVPLAAPAKSHIAKSFGLAASEDTGSLFTSYFLAWLIVVPPLSFLADRFGRKTMLLAGSLTLAVGMFSMSHVLKIAEIVRPMVGSNMTDPDLNLWIGCGAQFLNGAGAILLQIVGAAVLTDLYAEKRGNTLSLAVGIVGMIALMSPILMGKLLSNGVGWEQVYFYSAFLPLIAFVCQLFCAFPRAAGSVPITLGEVGQLLTNPMFVVLILSMLMYGIVEQGIPIWSSSYLGEELSQGQKPEETAEMQGYLVSAYFLIMSLVRAGIGAMGLFQKVSYPKMIVGSSILGAICLALGTLPNNATMTLIFIGLLGGAIAQIWPSIMTYAVQSSGKPTTTVFGLVVGIGGSTGCLIGADVLGRIKKAGLTYQQSLLTIEIPLLLLVIIFGVMAMKQRGSATDKS